ncbi:MAG: 23S rRNA (adenine(2503)-C(2))-methyltransferase RlmN [Actinomycetota bacterium]|nr:23S rRNA (adenine(2503)-C(2))-methyltransferase RlmN [Actinomycetota bacterium]
MSGTSPYLVPPEDLGSMLPGEPSFRSDQLRDWLYHSPVLTAEEMTNLPSAVREAIGDHLWPFEVDVDQSADNGRTRKWLFRAPDGAAVEAVLMGYRKRTTICISSQVGCAMGCTFCATGQFGFDRHLEAGEIVAQVAYANAFLRRFPIPGSPDRVTNVVYMGMGEPLANYERVRESLRRLIEVSGMSARSITVSTVGVVPGIDRLADEPWPVYLAVSLHGADDVTRSRLVPLNDRYPLEAVIESSEAYFAAKGRRISIEWTLINGVNDSDDQARKLATIAKRLRAHVNVIALNPTPLSDDRPSGDDRIRGFVETLLANGANATLRETRGQEIDAACGQLRLRRATE